MFNLYTPDRLAALDSHGIKLSAETQQKHNEALKKNSDDLKLYKKEKGNSADHSLLNINDKTAVVGQKLGEGYFGVAKTAMLTATGEFVVVKRVCFEPVLEGMTAALMQDEWKRVEEDFFAEVAALKIVGRYMGHGVRESRHGKKGYLLTQLHPGKDLDLFTGMGSFTFEQAVKILLGLIAELKLLHKHAIPHLHNDLHPGNVKIDLQNPAAPQVKLMDFGATRKVGEPCATFNQNTAPEIVKWDVPRTMASEVYSFGQLAMTIYDGLDLESYLLRGKDLCAQVSGCLNESPNERPAFEQLEKNLKSLLGAPAETVKLTTPSVPLGAQVRPKHSEKTVHPMGVDPESAHSRRKGCCTIL